MKNDNTGSEPEIVKIDTSPIEKKRTNPKSNSKQNIIAIILVVIAVIVIAFVYINHAKNNPFKTVSYSNGEGANFNISFYKQYSIKNVAKNTSPNSSSKINPNLNELVSQVSKSGKAPVTLWIERNSDTSSPFTSNDCTRDGLPKAFTVYIGYISAKVSVCTLASSGLDLINIVTYHDSKHSYIVYISQDIYTSSTKPTQQTASALLAKTGLSTYQSDLETIIATIQPTN